MGYRVHIGLVFHLIIYYFKTGHTRMRVVVVY